MLDARKRRAVARICQINTTTTARLRLKIDEQDDRRRTRGVIRIEGPRHNMISVFVFVADGYFSSTEVTYLIILYVL